jgi:hypothetical protein
MKNITLIFCCIITAYTAFALFNCNKKNKFESKLNLWMSYEDVSKLMPHPKNKLQRSLLADEYLMNDEERKCAVVYGLDLELEYGYILGFNGNYELVLINKVRRAIVKSPSGGVPVR